MGEWRRMRATRLLRNPLFPIACCYQPTGTRKLAKRPAKRPAMDRKQEPRPAHAS